MNHPEDLPDDALARQVGRALAMPDAPAAWVDAAVALGAPRPGLAAQVQRGIEGVIAMLRVDSWAPPAAAPVLAVRGGPDATRHLMFSTMGRDIDIRISPSGDGYRIAGQVLGPDEAGRVALKRQHAQPGADDAFEREAAIDAMGEFAFDGLGRGGVVIGFSLGGAEFRLPPIELGAVRR